MGYKARNKQGDPAPFGADKKAQKAALKPKAPRGSAAKAATRPAAKKQRRGQQQPPAARKAAGGSDDEDDDVIRRLEEQDSYDEDSDEEDGADDGNLQAARSALFDDADLRPPSDEDSEDDDEFAFEDEEGESVEGVVADEFDLDQSGALDDSDEFEESEEGEGADEAKSQFRIPILDEQGAPDGQSEDEDDDDDDDDDDEDGLKNIKEGILTDLRAVEKRMRSTARVLSNWKEFGAEATKSRAELRQQLVEDICQYHGYTPYLAEKLVDIFSANEALEFFTASDTPRPLTIRVNTLKARRKDLAQALINRGVNLEPLEGGWSKVGLQIFSGNVPIGATPEYLAGHYILQSASSFLPVMALDAQPNERCLDMSAAPGGKTTFMSAMMGNTGQVWANDSSRGRIKGLSGNIARLGCKNVVVTNLDGREFPKVIGGFDRVLLDAPCSGTGVISKDQSVKINKTERDFMLLSHLQKQLILSAIDSVSPNSPTGGYVVYSTCSVTTEENESVVSYALRKRPHVKLVDTGLPFGKEGFKKFRGKEFGKGIELTRRFYPHVHNMDGFYVAKFKVGKPQKKARSDDAGEVETPFEPIRDDEDEDAAGDGAEAPRFDDAEDEAIIEHSRKRHLKAKGINPKAHAFKKQRKS